MNYLFRLTSGKIISPAPVDIQDFASRICKSIGGDNLHQLSETQVSLIVRNRMLFVSYKVSFDIFHRRIRYKFGNENVVTALIFIVFGGLLLYNGRLDTYIFWQSVVCGIIYCINSMLTRARIEEAIRKILPVVETVAPPKPDDRTSITWQKKCPACKSPLLNFDRICPDCGISLDTIAESSSNLSSYRLKYFYKKN